MTETARGAILSRVRRVLKEIKPGAQFPIPTGPIGFHPPIETDLKRRVFGQLMGAEWHAADGMPALDAAEALGTPDTLEPLSPLFYAGIIHLQIVSYFGDPNAGAAMGPNGTYRVKDLLDHAVQDIEVAMQAVPYWTGADDDATPLVARGNLVIVAKQFGTDIYPEGTWGDAHLLYDIHYSFMPLQI